MKRKVYATRRERMIDQVLGFLAFPLVNVPLGIILWIIPQTTILSHTSNPGLLLVLISALPWLVNGVIIFLALLWRPEFAMGYITFIGVAVTVVTLLGVLFLAACFVTIFSATVIGDQQAKALFVVLMVSGLVGLGVLAIFSFLHWLSSYKNKSQ